MKNHEWNKLMNYLNISDLKGVFRVSKLNETSHESPWPALLLISCLMYDVTRTQSPLIISALNDPAWTNTSPGVGSNTAILLQLSQHSAGY